MAFLGGHTFRVTVCKRDSATWKPDKSGFHFTNRIQNVNCDDHPFETILAALEPNLLNNHIDYSSNCRSYFYGVSPATEHDDEVRFEILGNSDLAANLPFIPSAPKESRTPGIHFLSQSCM